MSICRDFFRNSLTNLNKKLEPMKFVGPQLCTNNIIVTQNKNNFYKKNHKNQISSKSTYDQILLKYTV